MSSRVRIWGSVLVGIGLITGIACAPARYMQKAQKAAEAGDYDRALEYCREAMRRHPEKIEYRTPCQRWRLLAAEVHFKRAEEIMASQPDSIETLEQAVLEYQRALSIEPTHQLAADRLRQAIERLKALKEAEAARPTEIERAKEKARRAGVLPRLIRSDELIDVKYRETSLKQIIDSMAKTVGLNVLYDKDYKDTRYTVELHGVTFLEALEYILEANGLFYKIINENTIMVIPDTPNKRRQHQELVVRTFYLSNADVNEIVNLLRNIAELQRIVPNTQLNALTVKGTPEQIEIAERIIALNDKARAEVVLDIEVLEVNRRVAAQYGIDLTGYAITQQLDVGEEPGVIRGHQIGGIDAASWLFTVPSIIYQALRSDTRTRVLARPQIRVSDGQQISIRLGNKVPIPVTTFAGVQPGQQISVVTPVTQFQMTDVGINIDIKPRVHHNREVTLDMKFELSSIAAPGRSALEPPTLGTRIINTVIRLRDGETNLLAGLLRQDERRSMRNIPGIEKIPLLRELFAANERNIEQTDIVFTITPHIIRMPNITEEDLQPIWVGTQMRPTLRKPPAYTVLTPSEATREAPETAPQPTEQPAPAAAPTPESAPTEPPPAEATPEPPPQSEEAAVPPSEETAPPQPTEKQAPAAEETASAETPSEQRPPQITPAWYLNLLPDGRMLLQLWTTGVTPGQLVVFTVRYDEATLGKPEVRRPQAPFPQMIAAWQPVVRPGTLILQTQWRAPVQPDDRVQIMQIVWPRPKAGEQTISVQLEVVIPAYGNTPLVNRVYVIPIQAGAEVQE